MVAAVGWKQQFLLFVKASGVSSESAEVQASLLVNLIGSEGFDVFQTFTFAADTEKDDVQAIIKKFDAYFGAKVNTTLLRYKFFTRNQEEGESIQAYVTALRLLSKNCEFSTLEDDLLKDRIVCGVRNVTVRDRLLRCEDLDLDKAIKMCQAEEASKESGCLPGKYHIVVDKSVPPVISATRKIPLGLRDRLHDELKNMEKMGVIRRVTHPTQWVHPLVLVAKKNGGIRICLDPRELNVAVRRAHYQLPSLTELATRLRGATCFSVLDANSGFWVVQLDDESADLWVLALYDVEASVLLSVDASRDALGAVIMQGGRPVEFASRTLTDAQRRYAQVEKELLAIVFACERFHQYIFVDGVIFKNNLVLVPRALRADMLETIHEGHMGIDRCKRRARQVVFWPGITQDIEAFVKRCRTCQESLNAPAREPLIPVEIPELPCTNAPSSDSMQPASADAHDEFKDACEEVGQTSECKTEPNAVDNKADSGSRPTVIMTRSRAKLINQK
ncbi:uncharacterized protein LOC134659037 [Cydia amplana]|uniref:uncharacterized protein LOC134659037 n=1 Tax=Cydia amplana TaxID=1869771 RepID=UPI002FE68638